MVSWISPEIAMKMYLIHKTTSMMRDNQSSDKNYYYESKKTSDSITRVEQ